MDERLAKIEQERQNALNESNAVYNNLLQDSQNLYNQLNEQALTYEQTQNDILDKQLAYNTDLINQQKKVAEENKRVEDMKAKNDYTQFINPYGYRNENLAGRGLAQSGVSETSMLGGFNTYQNRLASANKAMQDAFTQYDNEIAQARLNNDVQKAQNALSKLQMQIGFAQDYYSNKSNLAQNQLTNNQGLSDSYYNRYQTEYNNIQNELDRQEQIRQWQEEFNRQKNLDTQNQRNWEKEYALAQGKSSGKTSSGSTSSGTTLNNGTNLNGNTETNNSGDLFSTLGSIINMANNKLTNPLQTDAFGNSSSTRNNSDYYFKSTTGEDYQPRYLYNTKLTKSGKTLDNIGLKINGVSPSKNVWKGVDANGNTAYYVWDEDHYIDVTKYYK